LTDLCPLNGQTHTAANQASHAGHEHHTASNQNYASKHDETGNQNDPSKHHETGKQSEPSKYHDTKCFCYAMVGFNLIPPAPFGDIVFQATPVSFSFLLKTYTGRSVILDPGIPKRIA
jgi:hypothetical protein